MTSYIREYQKYILEKISNKELSNDLLAYHNLQISWLQHERLIHLIVLAITSLLLIISLIGLVLSDHLVFIVLLILFGLLEFAYVIHYYLLENTVQRWYKISNTISINLIKIGTNSYNIT